MEEFVRHIPIATTVMSAVFAFAIFARYRQKRGALHLLWWGVGVVLFGAGTFFESWTTLFGWESAVFRGWYITGALLGGAPLAMGTVYLLMPRRTAHRIAAGLVLYVAVASAFVLITPLDHVQVEENRLSGDVIEWTWVRAFSPLVNTGAFIALVGGAVVSAATYGRHGDARRVQANVLIALGAIFPGIGGSFTRAGYTEVLYVTEFVGLALFFVGFHLSVTRRAELGSTVPLPAESTTSQPAT